MAACLRHLPAPLPPMPGLPEGRLSPRALLILCRLLETREHHVVHLEGTPLALLAAGLQALPKPLCPRRIVLVTPRPAAAKATIKNTCSEDEQARIEIRNPLDPLGIDAHRSLYWDTPLREDVAPTRHALRIQVDLGGPVPQVHQTIHTPNTQTRLGLSGCVPRAALQMQRDLPDSQRSSVPLRRLLSSERRQMDAWSQTRHGHMGRLVEKTVSDLFERGPLDSADAGHRRARLLFHLGYLEQLTATRNTARALYQKSLLAHPGAEAWTFLGWLDAQDGDLRRAICSCRSAIETDPTLGNPYNDIGAYLFALGKNEEAKPWFHRALTAHRYIAPHYPLTNLARIHLLEGDLPTALHAALEALRTHDGYTPARRLVEQIKTRCDRTGR